MTKQKVTGTRKWIKRIRTYYLPMYEFLTERGQNSLKTEEFFKLAKRFPDGEIYFRFSNLEDTNAQLSRGKIGELYFYIMPKNNERTKTFQLYEEFLKKLFFSIIFYLQFAMPPEYKSEKRNYFIDFGLVAYAPGEVKKSKKKLSYGGSNFGWEEVEPASLKDFIEIRKHSRLDNLLFDEAAIMKKTSPASVSAIYIPTELVYGIAHLTSSELRQVRSEWLELRRALGLTEKQKRAFFLVKILEKLLKKFFVILAEEKRLNT